MILLDTALLNLTERLCRRFQVLTGRTNVWLAVQLTNLSIVIYFVWAGLYFQYFQRVSATFRVAVGVFCVGVLYALSRTVFRTPIEASESDAYRRVAKGLRNPRRLRDAPLRISFLTLTLVLLVPFQLVPELRVAMAFLTYSLIALTTALLYVLGCDPLPPCTGTAREWLAQASFLPGGSADARQPAPVVMPKRPAPRRR